MTQNAGKTIYVAHDIRCPIELLWARTQLPAEHVRWDVRFSEIAYLPRPDAAQPQRFEYATRLGLGLAIRGVGETAGETDRPDGSRASALRFWSDDPKSLIREGSGYWRYEPRGESVRFVTAYDYEVRFGVVGRLVDRLLFRPLIGRATAWSFDRLRLWIEQGIDPASAARHAIVYTAARLGVAFVWFYHGLVPKLVFRHPDEIVQLTDAGWSADAAQYGVMAAGAVEVVVGLLVLLCWRARWPMVFTIFAMVAAAGFIVLVSPQFLTSAFNAVTLNVTLSLLAAIVLCTHSGVPFSSRCVRRRPPS